MSRAAYSLLVATVESAPLQAQLAAEKVSAQHTWPRGAQVAADGTALGGADAEETDEAVEGFLFATLRKRCGDAPGCVAAWHGCAPAEVLNGPTSQRRGASLHRRSAAPTDAAQPVQLCGTPSLTSGHCLTEGGRECL